MTLPASGQIALSQIAGEYGGAAPHGFSEYYRGGLLVPNASPNLSVPTSGQIALSNFYGGSATALKNSLVMYFDFETATSSEASGAYTGTTFSGGEPGGVVGNSTPIMSGAASHNIAPPGSFGTGLTMGLWLRRPVGGTSFNWNMYYFTSSAGYTNQLMYGFAPFAGNHLRFYVTMLNSTFPDAYVQSSLAAGVAVSESWGLYVARYTSVSFLGRTARQLEISANGVTTASSTLVAGVGTLAPNSGTGRAFVWGGSGAPGMYADQAFVYSRFITDAEVLALYNGGAGRSYASLP